MRTLLAPPAAFIALAGSSLSAAVSIHIEGHVTGSDGLAPIPSSTPFALNYQVTEDSRQLAGILVEGILALDGWPDVRFSGSHYSYENEDFTGRLLLNIDIENQGNVFDPPTYYPGERFDEFELELDLGTRNSEDLTFDPLVDVLRTIDAGFTVSYLPTEPSAFSGETFTEVTSVTVVPEPSIVTLGACGGLFWLCNRRRRTSA